jgi:hypothetical protein
VPVSAASASALTLDTPTISRSDAIAQPHVCAVCALAPGRSLHCGQVLLYAHEDGEVAMCDLCLVTVTAIDECDLEWTWRTLAEARCMQLPSRMHAATSSGRAALAKARANAMFRGVRT